MKFGLEYLRENGLSAEAVPVLEAALGEKDQVEIRYRLRS